MKPKISTEYFCWLFGGECLITYNPYYMETNIIIKNTDVGYIDFTVSDAELKPSNRLKLIEQIKDIYLATLKTMYMYSEEKGVEIYDT